MFKIRRKGEWPCPSCNKNIGRYPCWHCGYDPKIDGLLDTGWFKKDIRDLLEGMDVGSSWIAEFAIFEKTGARELTLETRIHSPNTDTNGHIETVQLVVEDMGWTFKIDENIRDAGKVTQKKDQ